MLNPENSTPTGFPSETRRDFNPSRCATSPSLGKRMAHEAPEGQTNTIFFTSFSRETCSCESGITLNKSQEGIRTPQTFSGTRHGLLSRGIEPHSSKEAHPGTTNQSRSLGLGKSHESIVSPVFPDQSSEPRCILGRSGQLTLSGTVTAILDTSLPEAVTSAGNWRKPSPHRPVSWPELFVIDSIFKDLLTAIIRPQASPWDDGVAPVSANVVLWAARSAGPWKSHHDDTEPH